MLSFATSINATKEKVWAALWEDANYRQWTTAFMAGSYAESDWKEGSKILFLGSNGDGMFAVIQKKTENKEMIFKHLGEIKNGIEEEKDWGDSTEGYQLDETNGITTLTVRLHSAILPEMEQYFSTTFPKALELIKQIAEGL